MWGQKFSLRFRYGQNFFRYDVRYGMGVFAMFFAGPCPHPKKNEKKDKKNFANDLGV